MDLKNVTTAVVATAIVGSALAGGARAQDIGKLLGQSASRQGDKNNMRNIGIGAGAAAAYELLHGRGTHALILGAGAAYAGKKYEDARRAQNRANHPRFSYRQGSYGGPSNVAYAGDASRRHGNRYSHGSDESSFRHDLNRDRKNHHDNEKADKHGRGHDGE